MKPDKILFLTIFVSCLLCGSLYWLEAPSGVAGVQHPELKTMLQGISPSPDSLILISGWLLGTLTILIAVQLIHLGIRKPTKTLKRWINLSGFIQLACWSLLVAAYQNEIQSLSKGLWGMPPSAQILLLGMWPCPIVFMFVYFFGFDKWIFSKKDEQAFEELLKRRKIKEASHG